MRSDIVEMRADATGHALRRLVHHQRVRDEGILALAEEPPDPNRYRAQFQQAGAPPGRHLLDAGAQLPGVHRQPALAQGGALRGQQDAQLKNRLCHAFGLGQVAGPPAEGIEYGVGCNSGTAKCRPPWPAARGSRRAQRHGPRRHRRHHRPGRRLPTRPAVAPCSRRRSRRRRGLLIDIAPTPAIATTNIDAAAPRRRTRAGAQPGRRGCLVDVDENPSVQLTAGTSTR